jgi:hypothetical protein
VGRAVGAALALFEYQKSLKNSLERWRFPRVISNPWGILHAEPSSGLSRLVVLS